MNKQELKKILKPLIKECIKEVIFEDGVLSSVISEVMVGLKTTPLQKIQEQKTAHEQAGKGAALIEQQQKQQKQMLDAIGRDAYNGVNIFEGTTPTSTPGEPSRGPLAGTNSNDPGVDISNFISSNVWKKLAGN